MINFHSIKGGSIAFTTLAKRPHVGREDEVPANEYLRWHDEMYGTKITQIAQQCDLTTLPRHHVYWLMKADGIYRWEDLGALSPMMRKYVLSEYAILIREGHHRLDFVSDNEVATTIAIGYAGLDQWKFNAQSFETVHVHCVELSHQKSTEMFTPTGPQKVMYGVNLYYHVVCELQVYVQSLIGSCLRTNGISARVDYKHDEEAPFARACFTVDCSPDGIELVQALSFVVDFEQQLRLLWNVLSDKDCEGLCLNPNEVEIIKGIVGCDIKESKQYYPQKPSFTVIMKWRDDRVVSISIRPSCHGPAENLMGRFVNLDDEK